MDFRILGRLEVLDGQRDLAPGRPQARALLALFLLHANSRLTTDRLIDGLWPDAPPSTADKALQGHISTLRRLLGPSRIRTEQGGYRFEVLPGELDTDRFEQAVAVARAARASGERARLLGDALAMWRGEPLADLAGERFAQPHIARLEALRLSALEDRARAELELGRHRELLPELEPLLAQHPLSEGLRATVMVALYRSGRQADALRVYREGRRWLAEELGIDPGVELQQLERQVLAQDPALDAPPPVQPSPQARQERRVVTLLVLELEPAGSVDPEDLERLAGPQFDRVRAIIERHGGTTERLFANAILGIFGAPRAHEDDPVRAVRAALELFPVTDAPGLQLRGGVETGEALVTIEADQVAVTGSIVAAVSRLEAAAPSHTVLVGQGTFRTTEARFDYESAGPGAWRPIRERAPRPAPAAEAPFIGRSDELALLEGIFARARDESSVQLVTITAEPGGGKSRLVRELRAALDASPAPPTWRQGRCLPYGEGITFWGLGEIVKAEAEILESDDSETSRRKLHRAIELVEPDADRRTWFERSLAALVGLDGATASASSHEAFAVWRQFIEALAGRGPLVLVFEDIHWADAALLAFIDHLVSHASGVPLLVLCTARLELLEAQPAWGGGKRNATTISLEPLTTAETERLLGALLGRPPRRATIRRAGGNPLFAHELARIVGDSPSEEAVAIPDSLQAVIAARLDTLAPALKEVASDAAVVGEVFWTGAVAALTGLEEREVDARLRRLVTSDVVRQRRASSVAHQGEYGFLHILVRDVAYRQIPRRDRVAKHRAAAEWIEALARDRPTSHAELIAHHYGQALELAVALGLDADAQELTPRVRTFLALAGDGARTLEASQAEPYYRRALELTHSDDPGRGRLLGRLAEVADATGRLAEAEVLARQAIETLEAHGDLLGAGEATVGLAGTLWGLGRPESERRRMSLAAIRMLEQLPPGPSLVLAYSRMSTHELHAGREIECGKWARKALALAERLGATALKVQPLHHLGILRFEAGDESGIDDIREAVRLGREAGLSQETATAHTNLAAVLWVSAGPLVALEQKRAAAEFAASRGLVSLERTIRAEMLWQQFDAGAWDDALESTNQLLADRGSAANRVTMMAQTVRGRILVERGRTDEAAELEREFLGRARELRDPQDLGPALAAAAALRFALGDLDAATAMIDELARITRGRGASQQIHELPLAARVCRAGGMISVAEALIPARGLPTYTRARLCLASGRALVAEGHGDLRAALDLHAEAAAGWRAFGCPAEEAHALLGGARCLTGLDRTTDAAERARAARRIGRRLRAPLISLEAERYLE